VAADSAEDEFVLSIGDAWYFKLRICEKKIPGGPLKSELQRRAAAIERERGIPVKRAEMAELKEQLTLQLLPTIIQSERYTYGAIDLKQGLLIVGESAKKAEEFISALRSSLGRLPVATLGADEAPGRVYSNMIVEELEIEGVALGDRATLLNHGTKEKAVFTNADLHTDEVIAHIRSDMLPTQIKLVFDDVCSCLITDAFDIASIKVDDAAKERQGYDDIEDRSARLRADLYLWSNAVVHILNTLDAGMSLAPPRP
jgi:recombination associated protein RdgC